MTDRLFVENDFQLSFVLQNKLFALKSKAFEAHLRE